MLGLGRDKRADEARDRIRRKNDELAMQKLEEINAKLERDVRTLEQELRVTYAANKRWERMHASEHKQRIELENRIAHLQEHADTERLEVVPQAQPEVCISERIPESFTFEPWEPKDEAQYAPKKRGRPRKLDAELPE